MNEEIKNRTDLKLAESRGKDIHETTINGRKYIVFQGVFSPEIFLGTDWLSRTIPFPEQGSFLEIGTGCGCIAIEASLYGRCKFVTASDLSPAAVKNVQENAKRYNVQIDYIESDVFDSIKPHNFDMIFWNFPFHPSDKVLNEMDWLDRSIADPNYYHLEKYFRDARSFLAEKGRLLLTFSQEMGDVEKMENKAEKYGWKPKLMDTFRPKLLSLGKVFRDARSFLAEKGRLLLTFSQETGDIEKMENKAEKYGWKPKLMDTYKSTPESPVSISLYEMLSINDNKCS